MRSLPSGLSAHLAANKSYLFADLVTIETAGGAIYRYTTADAPIEYGVNTYKPAVIERGSTRLSNTLEIDTLDFTFCSGGKGTADDIVHLALTGALDGAVVTLERLFMPIFGDASLGAVTLFAGMVSTVEPSATVVRLQVKSDLERFDRLLPAQVQTTCRWVVYSPGCGLSEAAFTTTHTVGSGSSRKYFAYSPLSEVTLGWIEFTSGDNAGVRRSIESNSGGYLQLDVPLPYHPYMGETFKIIRGCSGERKECLNTFNNLQHFGGFADVPPSSGK